MACQGCDMPLEEARGAKYVGQVAAIDDDTKAMTKENERAESVIPISVLVDWFKEHDSNRQY